MIVVNSDSVNSDSDDDDDDDVCSVSQRWFVTEMAMT